MAWLVIVGTLPVVVVGFALHDWLKTNFYGNMQAIAVVAIVFAVVMGLAEWWAWRRAALGRPGRSEGDLGVWDALWVGAWQALALMPGASRSGTTITGGLFAGITRPVAARFSFVLSLPAVTGAGLKELYGEYKLYRTGHTGLFASGDEAAALAVGMAVAGLVGYLSIAWLLHFLKRVQHGGVHRLPARARGRAARRGRGRRAAVSGRHFFPSAAAVLAT